MERVEVMRKRRQRLQQAEENLALVLSEQDRLDQQIKLIRADAVATKNAETLTARIDATVEHLDQTNKWLSELDEFKDLVGDMPATETRVGYETSGRSSRTPPPVIPAAEPTRNPPRQRRSANEQNRMPKRLFLRKQKANRPPRCRRLPLHGWALELARRWNGGTYSLFILHGNIFDLFPFQENGSTPVWLAETFWSAPVPGTLLPDVLRHQRRPDLRLARNAEALLRVARGLRQRRKHQLPSDRAAARVRPAGPPAPPLLPAGGRGKGKMAGNHPDRRFPGETGPRHGGSATPAPRNA